MKQHLKGEVTSEGIAAHTDPFLELWGNSFDDSDLGALMAGAQLEQFAC